MLSIEKIAENFKEVAGTSIFSMVTKKTENKGKVVTDNWQQ